MTIFHTHLRCSSWSIYLSQNKSVKIRWQRKKLSLFPSPADYIYLAIKLATPAPQSRYSELIPLPAINSRKKRSLVYRFDSCYMCVVTVLHKSPIFQFCVHTLMFMNYGMCRAEMSLLWHKSGPLWPQTSKWSSTYSLPFSGTHKLYVAMTVRNVSSLPGGILPYMGYIGMCRCEGYGFQAVYSRIGYINQSVWV